MKGGDRLKEGEYLEWSSPCVLRNHPRLHFLEVEGRLCDDCPDSSFWIFLSLFHLLTKCLIQFVILRCMIFQWMGDSSFVSWRIPVCWPVLPLNMSGNGAVHCALHGGVWRERCEGRRISYSRNWILIPCISKFILSELDRWVSEPIGFRKSKSRNGTSKRSLKPKSINIGDTLSIGGKRSKSTMASWIYLLMFFPNSVSLGSSAIVKVPEQVGAAKSPGNRVPRKVPRKSFLLQENPSEQPDRHGARLGTRFPGRGSQARFLSKVPRNRFPSKVSKRFPGTGSQARVPSKRFPSKVPRNRFPSKVPRNRFPSKVPRKRFPARFPSKVPRQANQEQIPKQGFPGRGYQEECCQEEVPRQGSQAVPSKVPRNRFPSKGSQARAPSKRFPCKGSQEKVPKQGSQEEVPKPGFPGRVFQEQVPKQDFQVQVFPSKTRFPEQVFKQVFPGRGFQEEVSKQGSQQAGSQAMFPGRGSQARFPATGSQPQVPRNRCPYKVPKNRFTSEVPRMFPGKGSQAKFPATESQARLLGRGSQARFPGRGSQARVPSCSWIFLLGNQLFLGTLA